MSIHADIVIILMKYLNCVDTCYFFFQLSIRSNVSSGSRKIPQIEKEMLPKWSKLWDVSVDFLHFNLFDSVQDAWKC